MFFTREDILKIQQALLQLGVKDSELPSAESVTYDDTLSIVQDGKNKQIGAKDFCNQISLWKREDFINITDKYDKHYISLIKAINLVPILQRKDGLVITFQDVEGNWEIYQFRGNIIEFFEEDKWFNLYDYRNNIVQSIVPDEEDLTASTPDENGNSLVSLKDKVYDPTSFSGKGHKILRKNIQPINIAVTKIKVEFSPSSDGILSFSINGKETQVSVSVSVDNTTTLVADKIATKLTETMIEYEVSKDASTITLTRKFGGSVTPSVFSASTTGIVCTVTDSTKQELRNILTPIMMNQPNTTYIIRYDFDLNGETIEMQEGCTLKFEGGMFGNGVLNCKQSRVFIDDISQTSCLYNYKPQGVGKRIPIKIYASPYIINKSKQQIRTELLDFIKLGVDGLVICLHCNFYNNNYSIDEGLDNVIQYIEDAINFGLEIRAIKIHHSFKEDLEQGMNQYQNMVRNITQTFKRFNIKYFTVFNEDSSLYDSNITEIRNIAFNIIEIIKVAGYEPGVTCTYAVRYLQTQEIYQKLSSIMWNHYLSSGWKGANTTTNDVKDAFDDKVYKYYKAHGKRTIISEFGVISIWEGLINSAYWAALFKTNTPSYGEAPYIYLKGAFEAIIASNSIDEVWFWYSEEWFWYEKFKNKIFNLVNNLTKNNYVDEESL